MGCKNATATGFCLQMLARKSKGIDVKFFLFICYCCWHFERYDEYRAVQVKPNIEYCVVHMPCEWKRQREQEKEKKKVT